MRARARAGLPCREPDPPRGRSRAMEAPGDAARRPPRWARRGSRAFAIARTPRYRATQRHRVRDSARQGMVFVVAAALLNIAWLAPLHQDALALVVGLNVAVAISAAIGFTAIATVASRRPEVVVFLVLGVVDVATVTLGIYHPVLVVFVTGYLLLLPPSLRSWSRGRRGSMSRGLPSTLSRPRLSRTCTVELSQWRADGRAADPPAGRDRPECSRPHGRAPGPRGLVCPDRADPGAQPRSAAQ